MKAIDKKIIKIISGQRRVGKSYWMNLMPEEITMVLIKYIWKISC